MKTKDEILTYLKNNGHSNNAITKIMGFLIGAGLKDDAETIIYKRGTNTWDDFMHWYNNEPATDDSPLYYIFKILAEKRADVISPDDAKIVDDCIDFLIKEFVLDTTIDDENLIISGFEKKCERKNKKH